MDFNTQIKRTFQILEETSNHVFITGEAGTGKSTFLKYFRVHSKKRPIVLAPTGVAALNVNGHTIHHFFNFLPDISVAKITRKKATPRNPRLYKCLQMVIIDEVSMLRADLLDCIDTFLRMHGPCHKKAFGGVQLIFVGDLFQLPPVIPNQEKTLFSSVYKTPYFFSSNIMASVQLTFVTFDKVYRQKDTKFIEILNRIRANKVLHSDLELLNSRCLPEGEWENKRESCIYLTTNNRRAEQLNSKRLQVLKGKKECFTAVIEGDYRTEYYPTLLDLYFKIGAQIMLLNNDHKKRWVNGTLATIEAKKEENNGSAVLKIRLLKNAHLVSLHPHSWEGFKFSVIDGRIETELAGTFTQYPFRLAWAVTIHKSQGKTFDQIVVDTHGGVFAPGQIYVGISRCTSLDGIYLHRPLKRTDIRSDHRIDSFLSGHLPNNKR